MISRFLREARGRLLPHGLFFLVAWPALSILFAALGLHEHPLTSGVSFAALLLGTFAGALRMIPELLAAALCGLLLSIMLFGFIAAVPRVPPEGTGRKRGSGAEPLLLFMAGFLGVVLEYPALLHHPVLTPFRSLPVFLTLGILAAYTLAFAAALGWRQGGPRRAAILLPVAVGVVVLARFVSRAPAPSGRAGSHERVLLGIDSLSQNENVAILRSATKKLKGAWYERPVPPGLLTNSVWPSILMHRYPNETGLFFVFQNPDWARAPFNLLERARSEGCKTFAFLETGFTAYIAREAGIDVNRGGSRGWLAPATAAVKDASVFLPLLLPRLPAVPGAMTAPNQTGTFAYDLRSEVRAALAAGGDVRCSLVLSHLDYLHQTAFPTRSQMTPAQFRNVWNGQTGAVWDLALDWQNPVVSGQPFDVNTWKLAHVQRVIVEEIARSGFREPGNGNRLIIFSDHGNRRGISDENFGRERYHRVLFATFGIPPRDPAAPISLMDIPEMLGLPDPARPGPADPVVQYTNVNGDEWPRLMSSARLQSDGRVLLDPDIQEEIGKRLKGFRPYSGSPDYFPVPLSPKESRPVLRQY